MGEYGAASGVLRPRRLTSDRSFDRRPASDSRGQHARAFDAGLREVLRADGHPDREHARASGGGDADAILPGPGCGPGLMP